MERSNWILLLLGAPTAEGETPPLDPVRIMKGLFLLIQEGNLEDPPGYEFEPYHYGPVSMQIYDDLAELVEEGLVEQLAVPGYSWNKHQLSFRGTNCSEELRADLPEGVVEQIDKAKDTVSSLSFRALLRHVYGKYPEYAVNSVIGKV